MTPTQIQSWILSNFDHVVPKSAWGETSFFVNPGNRLPSGAYFATIKEKDGDNDKASDLNRDGVFRLNFGLGHPAYDDIFGTAPSRPAKGGIVEGPWDFTEQNKLMPHPIYGWMRWVCVLCPSSDTFEQCLSLIHI